MAKVTFTQGRRLFQQDNQLSATAKQALSQKIKREIAGSWITDDSVAKVVKAHRAEVVNMSRGFFSAAVNGAVALVNNSTVPVSDDGVRSFVKRPRGMGRTKPTKALGTVNREVVHQETLSGLTPSSVRVSFPVVWKKLTRKYRRKIPLSIQFFRKREETGSARLALNAEAVKWQAALKASNSYNKAKPIWQRQGDQFVSTFTINYPNLGKFDFIRTAFLHGLARTSVFPNGQPDNTGPNGILYAEHFRPLIRPYVVTVGRQFKSALEKLDKAP